MNSNVIENIVQSLEIQTEAFMLYKFMYAKGYNLFIIEIVMVIQFIP